ncbi:MAG: stage IV sporulation protein A, partial [Clostridia bacterium]|nr:stage IV sporulation protein A [Clostridia bacterium]
GKSTFIKRFMDILVLPGMQGEHEKARLRDELPQSAAGTTIMTTQPKFVPNEAARLSLVEGAEVRIRMVDCVGYMVKGATGHTENDMPRMVRTPWFDYDIPFEDAAEMGTRKVITEHSTIGVVVTTDGSIGQITRESYVEAEQRVVMELREQGKPFVILLNSTHPEDAETKQLADSLGTKYGAPVQPLDAMHMSAEAATGMLESMLYEFPMRMMQLCMPGWLSALGREHWLMKRIMEPLGNILPGVSRMRDYTAVLDALQDIEGFERITLRQVSLGSGQVELEIRPIEGMFYTILGEECGYEIKDDAHLIATMREFVGAKREYDRIRFALQRANATGYGMVPPSMEEMCLEEPSLMQQGGRYGVRLKARASGMHLIRIDVESEISPLVGTEEQSLEFMRYLTDAYKKDPNDLWQTNIFGKPLYDLVKDGMAAKVDRMPDEVQQKLQSTVQRMVNDGCNGLICILL